MPFRKRQLVPRLFQNTLGQVLRFINHQIGRWRQGAQFSRMGN